MRHDHEVAASCAPSRTAAAGDPRPGAPPQPMSPDPPPAFTFILRVWLEHGAGEEGRDEWRGELRRVPDGTRAYFRTIEQLPPVLLEVLDGTVPPRHCENG